MFRLGLQGSNHEFLLPLRVIATQLRYIYVVERSLLVSDTMHGWRIVLALERTTIVDQMARKQGV